MPGRPAFPLREKRRQRYRKPTRRIPWIPLLFPLIKTANPAASPTSWPSRHASAVAWSSGDYAVVGTTLQIVGEDLCEALDIRAGQSVIDVAAGNGNASLAAARRWCDVTATDYVAALLERARERAAADRLEIAFREADAEDLPFEDESFDVVMSTFGVMFTPDQERAAAELVRVCRSGGKIGLANWTPEGFIGQVFKTLGKYIAACRPASVRPRCGARAHASTNCSGSTPAEIKTAQRHFVFRYRSPAHWIHVFKSYYGPLLKAFAALDADDAGRTRTRPHPADRALQPLGRRNDGRAKRIPRNRHHARLIAAHFPNASGALHETHCSFHRSDSPAVFALGAGLRTDQRRPFIPDESGEGADHVSGDAINVGLRRRRRCRPGRRPRCCTAAPAKEGPFVLRLRFPAGFVVPPHQHSKDEFVTVISGRFSIVAGDKVDPSAFRALPPASFVHLPAGAPHYAVAETESVVQINGVGPFDVKYLNPKDDPRAQ